MDHGSQTFTHPLLGGTSSEKHHRETDCPLDIALPLSTPYSRILDLVQAFGPKRFHYSKKSEDEPQQFVVLISVSNIPVQK